MAEDNDVQRTLGRIEGKMDRILESSAALKEYTEKEVAELKKELKEERKARLKDQEDFNGRVTELEKMLWKVTGGGAALTFLLTYGPKLLKAAGAAP